MRLTLAAVFFLASFGACSRSDATIGLLLVNGDTLRPGSEDFGIYRVSTNVPENVGTALSGNPLWGLTVTVTNISGDPSKDINGIGDVTIGSNGALHHEQAPNVVPVFAYPTPEVQSFSVLGLPPSSVDSHFIHSSVGILPGGDPAETFSTVPSGVPVEVLDDVGFTTAQTGFGGVLTASYPFNFTSNSVDVAYLVFEGISSFDGFDFTLRPTNASGVSETLSGMIIIIVPEPVSALLAGAALLGFAARRR